MYNDCIAAISTPIGVGALAIVRLTGEGCLEIAGRIFKGDSSPGDVVKREVLVGKIYDPDTGEDVDEVVLSVFKMPGSYTGEDMVEICCHGGRYVPIVVLEVCLKNGARLAEAGEFTKRAFLNGKLDLIQAEAVASMIGSTTKRAYRLATEQLDGGLSREISGLREGLRELAALMEYDIDFPEEDDVDIREVEKGISEIKMRLNRLLDTWKEGALSTEGAVIVIAGRPNVGKSSLFNLMARKERAIVTPHPGTTRDAIEQEISVQGLLVRLVDTAGLRETEDVVERMGVEVSRKYLTVADMVLFLIEASKEMHKEEEKFLEEMKERDVVLILNKVDISEKARGQRVLGREPVYLSTKTGEGFEKLEEKILDIALGAAERTGPAITTLRQKRGLEEALAGMDKMVKGLGEGTSSEFLVEDLRESIRALGELVGEVTTEEILEAIFSRFCVGK
jgi:tRNA modification GTPase